MKVGVIQSCYIPWRGYFDFIDSVDLFVVYDDVQYSKGSWRNRNQLKTPYGLKWITVPVKVSLGQNIDEVLIDYSKPWQENNRGLLKTSLGTAEHFATARELWEEAISYQDSTISALNIRLLRSLCAFLDIKTPLVLSADYKLSGSKTERLIQLLKAVGASVYLSGPSAQDYLDYSLFHDNGIRLEYKNYNYEPYPQQFGEFVGTVSVLDLIANIGRDARRYLKSISPDIAVV